MTKNALNHATAKSYPIKPMVAVVRALFFSAIILAEQGTFISVAKAEAVAATKQIYNIPAGSLSKVLSQFAADSGVLLSADAALAEGKTSKGLQGSYTVEDGFAALLVNSELIAVKNATGGYTITKKTLPIVKTETLPEIAVSADTEKETAISHVNGYVAKRSATATKTDTSIMETPQSISVVTADRIAAIGATNLRDALAYTPGVNISPFGPDSRFESTWFYLRGFDTYNPGPNMDGLPLRNNYTWAVWQTDNYATERIEILRGPASVLYGQVSPGGTVNVVTKRPTKETLRELQVQVGSYDRHQIAGDFSGPIDDEGKFLYRLTGVMRDAEYPVNGVADDRVFIAPAFTWQPTDDTSLTVLSHYLRGRAGVYSRVAREQGSLVSNPDGSYTPESTFIGDPKFDHQDQDQWAIGYSFDQRLNDAWRFRQNARYGKIRTRLDEVFSGTDYVTVNSDPTDPANYRSINRSVFGSDENARTLAIDNQLQGDFVQGLFTNTWLLGLDYQNSRFDQTTYYGDANAPLDLYAPVYGQNISIPDPYFDGTTRLKQTGVYGQLQSKFDDSIVITLGGRYDKATVKTNELVNAAKSEQSDSEFTGRAGAVYLFPNGLAPYASYSESFYPSTTINPETGKVFSPETARQYELGLRYQPLGRNDTYSIALFDLRRQNYITNDVFLRPRQTGEVTVQGVELEAIVEPVSNLKLTASYAWTPKAEITASSTQSEIGINVNGVSEHMGSLWADYRFNSGFKVGFGARYVGSNHGIADAASAKVPSYTVLDAMAGYLYHAWEFAVNARNLTDKTYFASCGYGSCYYGDQRRVNTTLTYRW